MAQPTSLGRALWSPSALALAPRRPPAKTFPVLKPPARPRPPAPRRHTTYSYLQARQSPEMVRDEPLDFENEDDPLIPTRRPAKRYTDPPAPLFSPSPPLPSPLRPHRARAEPCGWRCSIRCRAFRCPALEQSRCSPSVNSTPIV